MEIFKKFPSVNDDLKTMENERAKILTGELGWYFCPLLLLRICKIVWTCVWTSVCVCVGIDT